MADEAQQTELPTEIGEKELPKELADLVQKAKNAFEIQNHKYTVAILQGVLKAEPGFLDGRRLLRQSEIALAGGAKKKGGLGLGAMKFQGQIKKDALGAIVAIEKELEKDPYNPGLNELLFEAAMRMGMVGTATFALETVRKGAPENKKLMHKLADFYKDQERPDKAAEVYHDIVKIDPSDTAAVKGEKDATARASMLKQRTDSGDFVLGKKDESETLSLEKSARAALTKDQLEEKRDNLVAAYEQDPNDVPTVKELASVYEQLEEWTHAHTFYDWAHQLSTGDIALKAKADVMKDKAADAEIKDLEDRLAENPNDEELRAELADIQQSRIATQVEERKKRVEQNPTDPHLRYELGLSLYHAGEFSEAIPHLQQATRNPHIRTKVLLLLGRTFDGKGMHDLAVKQLEDANAELMVMDATKKEVLYALGLIHDKMDEKEKALDCFKQIYENDYGYLDVAQRVEQSYGG